MELGPCFYERHVTKQTEGTCSPEAALCANIPPLCFDCKDCGGGYLNICDKTECIVTIGQNTYCKFKPRIGPFWGLCSPNEAACKK